MTPVTPPPKPREASTSRPAPAPPAPRAGARVLFASVFGNIIDLVRVLALLLAGTPHVLGAAGESWLRTLGGPSGASWLSAFALLAWIFIPLAIAVRIRESRDL